jgi:hypothetical protein
MADGLNDVRKNFGSSSDEAKRLTNQVKGLGEQFQNLASTVVRSSGMGGGLGSLIGITSVGAAVTAVGVIVGQSIRMAYEFEKASVKAAAALSVGMGSGFAGNLNRIQSAAYSGEKYGYSVQVMTDAMAQYGRSSGANAAQAASAAPLMARLARSYGLEPSQVAGLVGGATALNGESFSSAAGALFGGAEHGGNFGRRTEEFIGAATSALAALQYSNPELNQSAAGPSAFMARMGQLGGFFGTAAGAGAAFSAIQGVSTGADSDIRRAALSYRAGVSPLDALYGRSGPNNANSFRILRELTRESGDPNTLRGGMALVGLVGQDQARTLAALYAKNGNSWSFATDPGSPDYGRAQAAMATPAGQVQQWMARAENTMTADGKKGLDSLVHVFDALGQQNPVVTAIELSTVAIVGAILTGKLIGALPGLGGAAGAAGVRGLLGKIAGPIAAPIALGFAVEGLEQDIQHGTVNGRRLKRNPFADSLTYASLRAQGVNNSVAGALAVDAAYVGPHADIINAAARKHGIPPLLLAALPDMESAFGGTLDKNGLGDHGHGHGMFQIDDRTWAKWLKTHHNGMNAAEAADLAASLISSDWESHHDVRRIGGIYNAGNPNAAGTNDYADRLVSTLNNSVKVPGGKIQITAKFVKDHDKPNAGGRISSRPVASF